MNNILPIEMLGMFGQKSHNNSWWVFEACFFCTWAFDPIWCAQDVFQIDGSPTGPPNMDDMMTWISWPLKWVV